MPSDAPDASAETFGGEWFHTKDAARLDDDGYVFVFDVSQADPKDPNSYTAVIDLKQFADRGHSLAIGGRSRQVAHIVLE